jgi:hypothetical protein
MNWKVVVSIVAVFLVAPLAHAQSQSALESGKVFVKTEEVQGSDIPRMVVTAIVDAPPQKIFDLVTDCDKFPGRLPRIKEARTLKKHSDGHTCEVTLGLPFPLSDLTAVTRDRRKEGPDEWYRKWKLVKNVETDYKINNGGFFLKPYQDDPNRTLFVYKVHAEPKTIVPDFLRERAQKKSLPGMVERIRKEVKKL